LSVLKGTLL